MDRLMTLLKLSGFMLVWLAFLLGVPWFLGFFLCRFAACWHDKDKIKTYISVSSPRIAALLIPGHEGFSDHIRTNLPFLYNRYRVNPYPDRLSLLGLIEYCIVGLLSVWYGVCITEYFFLQNFNNPMILITIALFICHALIFVILINWNRSHGNGGEEIIQRKEMRRRKKCKEHNHS